MDVDTEEPAAQRTEEMFFPVWVTFERPLDWNGSELATEWGNKKTHRHNKTQQNKQITTHTQKNTKPNCSGCRDYLDLLGLLRDC